MSSAMQIIGTPQAAAGVFRVAYACSKGGPRFFAGELFPYLKQMSKMAPPYSGHANHSDEVTTRPAIAAGLW